MLKISPYLLNDLCIYYKSLISRKSFPFLLKTFVYIISPSPIEKIPLIYWKTLEYIINPFTVLKMSHFYLLNDLRIYYKSLTSRKNSPPVIYWKTLEYIISPFTVLKMSPFLLNDLRIYYKSLTGRKNSPYLLNDLRIFYKSLTSRKISPFLLNELRIYSWIDLCVFNSCSSLLTSLYLFSSANVRLSAGQSSFLK